MKLKMELYLNGLKKIKRTIQLNDTLSLQMFCEYVVISMNGNCKHLYQLIINDSYCYLGPKCMVLDADTEEMMEDKTLECLDLVPRDKLMVNYDFKSDWEFILKVKSVEEGYYDKDFEVISGEGCGILEDCLGVHNLKKLIDPNLTTREREIGEQFFRGFKEYDVSKFNVEEINNKITNYMDFMREKIRPKHYIMNISLEGYEKVLKREMSVDSNVNLDSFCNCVLVSMGVNLGYPYAIKINRKCLEEEVLDTEDLNYLNLKERQKFKILCHHENNWTFNVTVSKRNDGYGEERRVKVLSRIGYAINDLKKDIKEQDIREIDIEKLNLMIDRYV